jgi:hypothetical protein
MKRFQTLLSISTCAPAARRCAHSLARRERAAAAAEDRTQKTLAGSIK